MGKWVILVLTIELLLTGCNRNAEQPDSVPQNGANKEVTTGSSTKPVDTLGPDCYGEETHPIGQAIVEVYPEETDYDQVMLWFCNGFEFEDIMTALQTAVDTELTADALLIMFEGGQTWEEIWGAIGLAEK